MILSNLGESSSSQLEIKMADALEALIAKAQKIRMTDDQAREQRLSFVYGNTHIENTRITREMVEEADKKVSEDKRADQNAAKPPSL